MIRAIDHVQIAIPPGGEAAARPFYGGLLGLPEVPKPAELAGRDGCWFESAQVKVHLGVEQDFRASVKAHVAFQVDDRDGLADRARAAGLKVTADRDQLYIFDPFGNRIEFVSIASATEDPDDDARHAAWSFVGDLARRAGDDPELQRLYALKGVSEVAYKLAADRLVQPDALARQLNAMADYVLKNMK